MSFFSHEIQNATVQNHTQTYFEDKNKNTHYDYIMVEKRPLCDSYIKEHTGIHVMYVNNVIECVVLTLLSFKSTNSGACSSVFSPANWTHPQKILSYFSIWNIYVYMALLYVQLLLLFSLPRFMSYSARARNQHVKIYIQSNTHTRLSGHGRIQIIISHRVPRSRLICSISVHKPYIAHQIGGGPTC